MLWRDCADAQSRQSIHAQSRESDARSTKFSSVGSFGVVKGYCIYKNETSFDYDAQMINRSFSGRKQI